MNKGRSDLKVDRFKEAVAAHKEGRLDEAEKRYVELLVENPNNPGAWSNLAAIRRKRGHAKAAFLMVLRAMELKADYKRFGKNLINALMQANRGFDGLSLGLIDPRNQFGSETIDAEWIAKVLVDQGRAREAIPVFHKALKQSPDNDDLRIDATMALLKSGHFKKGFEMFEARWRTGHMRPPPTQGKRWRGESLNGDKVVVLGEQGFGDMIFLSRFFPLLFQMKPAHLTLGVRDPLIGLFAGLEGFDSVLPRDEVVHTNDTKWMVGFDLAWHLVAEDGQFPPPLVVQIPQRAKERAARLVANYQSRFKIGIVWKTEKTGKLAERKSLPLESFLFLCEIPNVQLFSLHKGTETTDIQNLGATELIIDVGSTDADFSDTAAVIQALDLVITVDTAVAHLAGTLGAEVWMLASEPTFWYWHGIGERTPYYPSMRVIRQSEPDQWSDVFNRIKNDLTRLLR